MSEGYGSYPDYGMRKAPKWGTCLHLKEKGIKSWLTFGQMDKDGFDHRTSYERYFIDIRSQVPMEEFGF